MTTIKAGTTSTTGFVVDTDASGTLILQSGGSNNAVIIDSQTQQATFTQAISQPGSFMFRNRIINGDMRIDQRNVGDAVTANNSSVYPVDRWFLQVSGPTVNVTAQRSTVVPSGIFSHSVVITAPTAINTTAAQQILLQHRIEGFHCADFAWGTADAQPVTLSFWVRSSVAGSYTGALNNGNASYVFVYDIAAGNTWQRVVIAIPGTVNYAFANKEDGVGIYLVFDLGSGTNFETASPNTWITGDFKRTNSAVKWANNAGATFYATGIQLETGSVATSFEQRFFTAELDLCRRYFQKSYNLNQKPGTITGQFSGGTATYTEVTATFHQLSTVQLTPPMRGNPGITIYNPTTGATASLWAQATGNVPAYVSMSNSTAFQIGVNNTSITAVQGLFAHWAASAEI